MDTGDDSPTHQRRQLITHDNIEREYPSLSPYYDEEHTGLAGVPTSPPSAYDVNYMSAGGQIVTKAARPPIPPRDPRRPPEAPAPLTPRRQQATQSPHGDVLNVTQELRDTVTPPGLRVNTYNVSYNVSSSPSSPEDDAAEDISFSPSVAQSAVPIAPSITVQTRSKSKLRQLAPLKIPPRTPSRLPLPQKITPTGTNSTAEKPLHTQSVRKTERSTTPRLEYPASAGDDVIPKKPSLRTQVSYDTGLAKINAQSQTTHCPGSQRSYRAKILQESQPERNPHSIHGSM